MVKIPSSKIDTNLSTPVSDRLPKNGPTSDNKVKISATNLIIKVTP